MLFGLLLTLGVAVLSVALRSYQTALAQKVGALGVLIASFLAVYFITGNAGWGLAGAASWLFLPWLEILTRIRTLRLPKEKRLRPKSPPSPSLFPALDEISRNFESIANGRIRHFGSFIKATANFCGIIPLKRLRSTLSMKNGCKPTLKMICAIRLRTMSGRGSSSRRRMTK